MTKWIAKYNHTKEAQAMVAHSGLLNKIDVRVFYRYKCDTLGKIKHT